MCPSLNVLDGSLPSPVIAHRPVHTTTVCFGGRSSTRSIISPLANIATGDWSIPPAMVRHGPRGVLSLRNKYPLGDPWHPRIPRQPWPLILTNHSSWSRTSGLQLDAREVIVLRHRVDFLFLADIRPQDTPRACLSQSSGLVGIGGQTYTCGWLAICCTTSPAVLFHNQVDHRSAKRGFANGAFSW